MEPNDDIQPQETPPGTPHPEMSPREVVLNFWAAMGTNDFRAASEWLSDDYVGLWPQSGERIVGRANFVEINTNYPAHGPWEFEVRRIVAEHQEVVTDVSVRDGTTTAEVISFHSVRDGRICRQLEYWPDPYDPPSWRRRWVEIVSGPASAQ